MKVKLLIEQYDREYQQLQTLQEQIESECGYLYRLLTPYVKYPYVIEFNRKFNTCFYWVIRDMYEQCALGPFIDTKRPFKPCINPKLKKMHFNAEAEPEIPRSNNMYLVHSQVQRSLNYIETHLNNQKKIMVTVLQQMILDADGIDVRLITNLLKWFEENHHLDYVRDIKCNEMPELLMMCAI